MNSTFLIILALAFCCYILPAIAYNMIYSRNYSIIRLVSPAFIPMCLSIMLISLVTYFLFYDDTQFLTSMSFPELIMPFVLSLLIYVVGTRIPQLTSIALILSTIICAYSIPDNAVSAVAPFPVLYNRLLIAAAWTFFCYIFKYSNTEDTMSVSQAITICGGIAVLGLTNAIPPFIGMIGLFFVTGLLALLTFNWYPARIKLKEIDVLCLGFIVFALMVWATTENALSCVIIYSLYLFIDFTIALLLLCTFAPGFRSVLQNTSCRQALLNGISPSVAIYFSYRIQILLLFLGAFQALAPHKFSLILVSSLITLWLLYRLRTLQPEIITQNNIKRNILEDMQSRIDDLKQHIEEEDKL